jgi:hypothetical protein
VIYSATKQSVHPGPRARLIRPSRGESYSYAVDKLWAVREVLGDGRLVLVTRRGKRHVLTPGDIRLRRASWWERLVLRRRFPPLELPLPPASSADSAPRA